MSEDWDLFAVVRSCCSSSVSTATTNTTSYGGTCKQPDPPPLFTHIHGDRERESSSCNELQDSCKPFLPVTNSCSSSSPLLSLPVVSSAPNALMKQEQGFLEGQDQKAPLGVRVFPASTGTISSSSSSSSSVFVFRSQRDQLLQQPSQAPLRSRKRKNQQKRTICHVTQENLSSDMWAWRKYGQKPIKGSPYPRNYYRCSSSKGCLARKQVERSNLDSNIFIISYTGEHTHPLPTHRNSLAGSVRNKSQPVIPIPKPENPSGETVKEEIHLSPTTPLKESDDVQGTNGDEDMNSQEVNLEDEEEEDEDEDVEDNDVDDLLIPNLAVRDRDDLFFAGNFPSWSAGSGGG